MSTYYKCDEDGCEDTTNLNNLDSWTVIRVETGGTTFEIHLCPTCAIKALSRRATALNLERKA